MVSKKCLICGKEFKTIPSAIKNNKGKYCSRECFYESNNYHLTQKCLNCGKIFCVTPAGKKIRKYCCRNCTYKGRINRIRKICIVCNKIFHVPQCEKNRKYCTRKCFYTDPNRKRYSGKLHWNWKDGRTIKKCLICNKQFWVFNCQLKTGGGIYCSKKCYYEDMRNGKLNKSCFKKGHKGFGTPEGYVKQAKKMKVIMKGRYKGERHSPSTEFKKGVHNNVGENNPMWIDGGSHEPYAFEFNKELKEQIRTRDNFMCQKCGRIEEEELNNLNKKLSIHHIDYDKKNCNPNNLITLCSSCNSKVNFKRLSWTAYFLAILSSQNLLN